MRRPFALLVTIGALAAPLSAQTVPVDSVKPVPAASPASATAFEESLRLGRSTNRMTVPVSVADRGPFPFIIDTGAERSIISRELADYLQLDRGRDVRLFDFTGPADVNTVRISSLTAGKLGTSAIEAPMLMMADIGAPGMLGIDALQGYKLILDFERNRLLLQPAKRHANGDIVLRAEARAGQLIVTEAWYEGQRIAVVIDTGSWLSIGNSAMLKLARKKPRAYGIVSMTSVTGREFKASYVGVEDVRIGTVKFDRFGLAFADVEPFRRFGLADRPALILGMNSLQLFRKVEIDFLNREVGFSMVPPQIDWHDVCRNGSAGCTRI